jgi:pyruvate formate lyase activating enzyme
LSLSNNKQGTIFNIQKFSVHDGPGIRTIVFLKGCPLRCLWCSNPESQNSHIEIAWSAQKCIGCNQCMDSCNDKNIFLNEKNELKINRQSCTNCFKCASVCPSRALHVIGEEKNVDEILDEVEADEIFYSNSKGGLTLSGGEPLLQGEFAIELLKEAKHRRIDCAIETTGYVEWQVLKEACKYLDTILFDIKCIDSEKHKKFTGVNNERIMENFTKMCTEFSDKPVIARTPIIPGFNDSEEDIIGIIDFLKQFSNVSYEFLPYHRLGESKYISLDRLYPLGDVKIDMEKMKKFNEIAKERFGYDNK